MHTELAGTFGQRDWDNIMGYRVAAKCLDCGKSFTVDHGGGFLFYLVRCDKCGKTKSIDVADRRKDAVEPTSEDAEQGGIEALAGRCRCRGKYKLDAPPRCPKCRSTRVEEGAAQLMYD